MKKAIIETGGTQHLVAKGDQIIVNFLGDDADKLSFTPLMIVNGKSSVVDATKLKALKVEAKVIDNAMQGAKVVSLRYKAKKRVNTKRGHRQKLTKLEIVSI